MMTTLKRLALEEEGADATEYALLAALVAVALIGGATFLGGALNGIFNGVGNKLNTTTIP
ncbi:MAG TPA: Flp family type IVb pilin [Chloroflexota bacterium]|nr:Flp family type IVb pilin [Chloroflexota bacterium]